jgi:tellurite resistance protein TerC
MMFDKPLWMWAVFLGLIGILLAFDLGVLHRKQRQMSIRESLWLSAGYIAIAAAFGGWVWYALGGQSGKEYFTGFVIEKTLAIDNVFVISLIFSALSIPQAYQHRVLFWGILGVIVLRAIMIGAGAALVSQFSWVLVLFALFLIGTGAKMLLVQAQDPDIAANPVLKLLRRYLRITPELHGSKFLVRLPDAGGTARWWCTPLLIALILVELADLVFAVDSVPAIFAITTDPYIVYTSNIFAILGLRALYFALAAIVHRFRYLKHALALVLIFIGGKIIAADVLGLEKIPAALSLGVTVVLIAGGIVYSLWRSRAAAPAVR